MKRESLLTVVVLLLLLNFGTLGYLFLRRPPHPPGAGSRRIDRNIIEKLALNQAQQQQFEKLKSAHREQMLQLEKTYRIGMESYFGLLKQPRISAAEQDSIQGILLGIQGERLKVTFRHFEDLKAMCTAEQKINFNALIPDLMEIILPPRPLSPPSDNN